MPLPCLPNFPKQWLDLAWQAEAKAFHAFLEQQRVGGAPATQLVELALLSLVAGMEDCGDDLLVEADEQLPDLALIPDRWSLWPADQARSLDKPGLRTRQWATTYLELRHCSPNQLAESWHSQVWVQVEPDPAVLWPQLLKPEPLALLAIVLGKPEADHLVRSELEPLLVEALGETVVLGEPDIALWFWSGVSRRCASWDYARLKAADLCLKAGQFELTLAHLGGATCEQLKNPWMQDIRARLADVEGRTEEALQYWDLAITLASGDEGLVELFRQRRETAKWAQPSVNACDPIGHKDAQQQQFSERINVLAARFEIVLPEEDNASPMDSEPEDFSRFLELASARLALAG